MQSNVRISREFSPTSSMPSPPSGMAPMAVAESSDVASEQRTPQNSEEMRRALQLVPPSDSMLEVRAMPADAYSEPPGEDDDGEEEEEGRVVAPSGADAPGSPRRIIFPITPFYSTKEGCSRCNLWLAILVVLFLLLSIALFLVWAITSDGFRNLGKGHSTKVCSSRECINTAFRMSSYMDESIDACDNFYRHSCNKFHLLNSDQQNNFIDKQKDLVSRAVFGLLSNDPDVGPRSARLAKILYASCMDATERAKIGGYSLLNLLRNLPCGPVFSECGEFNQDFYNWERHCGMVDWYAGEWNLVVYGRDVDPGDRSKLVLQIRPPNLDSLLQPLRDELIAQTQPGRSEIDALLQLTLRQKLLNDLVSRQLMRDPREVEDQLDEVALLIIEVNRAVAKSPFSAHNTTYMSIGELFRTIPQINFADMMNAQLSSVYKWNEGDVVAVQDLDYFLQLAQIVSRTARRAVANYLVLMTGFNLRQYSYDPRVQFSWRDCVQQLSGLEPVEKLYILQHKNFTATKTLRFLETLKKDFLATHRQHPLQYLSDINRLAFMAGYPKKRSNEDLVWKPFSDLSLNQSDYFSSVVATWRAQHTFSLSEIGTHLDADDSPVYPLLSPTIVYEPHQNTMVFPISFLQDPLSLPGDNVPWYSVYGSLGVVTQQMIAKIFWSRLDQRNAKQCFDNIYRSFLNPSFRNSLDVTGDLSYTIEMADGLKTAAYGYLQWQTDNQIYEERPLPAHEQLDSMQSMLLDFGTLFCNTEAAAAGSEFEAMINTVMSNTRLFSMHFQCTNSSAIFNRRLCV